MASDCEQLFGLNLPFSEDELKKKYRELAKASHPDKFFNSTHTEQEKAHEMFTRVGLCKDELKASIKGKSSSGHKRTGAANMTGKGWTTFTDYIDHLRQDTDINVVWDEHLSGKDPIFQEPQQPLSDELKQYLHHELYTHQAEAIDHYRNGENLVLVTPTASGKSLGYMLPFFEQVQIDPDATAIFIFPMKALANDQYANFERLTNGTVTQAVFDGDTDEDTKFTIKNNPPNVLFTNPDELHHSILYTANKWTAFFKNLKLIVLDEAHIYKGSFGSNVSNVIARLLHVVKTAGSAPQFVCTSATISNPIPVVEKLTSKKFHLINQSGAGQAEKYLVMLEPRLDDDKIPIISAPNIAVHEAINLASNGHQVIVFVNSRAEVDVLANHAKHVLQMEQGPQPQNTRTKGNLPAKITPDQIVTGYHAGYSRDTRRRIEARIKSGHTNIIFSTNALELGIDIGTLDVCILLGIPPTNNEIWQRIGRAGRKSDKPAVVLMINNGTAFDKYHFANPHLFLSGRNNPDRPIIDPMNAKIRKLHLNCGYFEGMQAGDVADAANWSKIDKSINKWWAYHRIQIRGGNPNPYTLKDVAGKELGEIDYDRAYRDLYPGALFEIDGTTFKYKHRDYKERTFTLENLLQSDEYTTPLVENDVRIDESTKCESILKYGSHSIIIGHGQMELDKRVCAYNLRHKIDPKVKQFKSIKYPNKWPTEKVFGFWLSPLSGTEKDWENIISDYPEVGPYSIFCAVSDQFGSFDLNK